MPGQGVHSVALEEEYVLTGHARQLVEFPKKPARQDVHTPVLTKLAPGHVTSIHVQAVLPAVLLDPRGHWLQRRVDPVPVGIKLGIQVHVLEPLIEDELDGHGLHIAWPSVLYVPASHGVQMDCPAELLKPAGQGKHAAAD